MYWIISLLLIFSWVKVPKKLILLLFSVCIKWHFKGLTRAEKKSLVGDISKMEIIENINGITLILCSAAGEVSLKMYRRRFMLHYDTGLYNHGVQGGSIWELLTQRNTIRYQIQQL